MKNLVVGLRFLNPNRALKITSFLAYEDCVAVTHSALEASQANSTRDTLDPVLCFRRRVDAVFVVDDATRQRYHSTQVSDIALHITSQIHSIVEINVVGLQRSTASSSNAVDPLWLPDYITTWSREL